jgi:Outer membrane protein beta-barrel domain
MSRLVLLLLALFSFHSFAQQVAFGLKGGFRATNDISTNAGGNSKSPRYLVGPSVEVELPRGFRFEADVLYSRIGYDSFFGNPFTTASTRARGAAWEFPLLLKYSPPVPKIRPYVEGGYAPRRTGGHIDGEGSTTNPITGVTEKYTASHSWQGKLTHGLVAGGGAETTMGAFRLGLGVRYTRWSRDYINQFGSHGYFVQANQNQVQILASFSWLTLRR